MWPRPSRTQPAVNGPLPATTRAARAAAAMVGGRRHWRLGVAVPMSVALVAAILRLEPVLARPAQAALAVFGMALIAWTVLRLDETPVALAAGAALVLLGATKPAVFYAGLGDGLIWLLLGAFVMSAALASSGLAERWTRRAVAGAGSLHALMHRLNLAVGLTAFLVPSTSARAALLMPMALALVQSLGSAASRKAVLLLMPTSVLLTACASLLGAGAHLVAVDWMARLGAPRAGFAQWAAWAAPFALASSVLATECIVRVCLPEGERRRPLPPVLAARHDAPLSGRQRAIAAITALTVAGFATSSWHGVDLAVVALVGALAMTIEPLTGLELKSALKRVEWNLLLFLAATLVMGHALLETGAASALSSALMVALGVAPASAWNTPAVLSLAALLSLLSHLWITSRTARALVLLPTVAVPLAATGVDAALLVMLCTVGSGFCQTLRVSAKPVALFAAAEVDAASAITESDLLRLSATLLLPLWLLLLAFALWVWPLLGVGVA